jgi:hypothetical protein
MLMAAVALTGDLDENRVRDRIGDVAAEAGHASTSSS